MNHPAPADADPQELAEWQASLQSLLTSAAPERVRPDRPAPWSI